MPRVGDAALRERGLPGGRPVPPELPVMAVAMLKLLT
jgi:hypothetical protein